MLVSRSGFPTLIAALFVAVVLSPLSSTAAQDEEARLLSALRNPNAPIEDLLQAKLGLKALWASQGRYQRFDPNETWGTTIVVAGRAVRLPSDARLRAIITRIDCFSPCREALEVPLLWVERGRSSIHIGERSGRVVQVRLAPGEEKVFDFLDGYVIYDSR